MVKVKVSHSLIAVGVVGQAVKHVSTAVVAITIAMRC